jgi:hypothetical protein
MPAGFTLDHERRLVDSRAWGVLSSQDMLDHLGAIRVLFRDRTIDGTWSQVADLSEVTTTDDLDVETVRDLARANPWPAASRRVIIAPMTVIFGLSRMYQLLIGDTGETVAVVRTRTEALERLELDATR